MGEIFGVAAQTTDNGGDNMDWKYVIPLKSYTSIIEFENIAEYRFPPDFKKCVKLYNGGLPTKNAFDTDKHSERLLKTFLSFNKEDIDSVWNAIEWSKEELSGKYVTFAIDNFGNLVCFDIHNDEIVFIDHETFNIEKVADSFSNFLEKLYE